MDVRDRNKYSELRGGAYEHKHSFSVFSLFLMRRVVVLNRYRANGPNMYNSTTKHELRKKQLSETLQHVMRGRRTKRGKPIN